MFTAYRGVSHIIIPYRTVNSNLHSVFWCVYGDVIVQLSPLAALFHASPTIADSLPGAAS